MEFRHLESFVAVAEELHFRRAAERLHIVQPALSQQIARLEADVGVPLLVRDKRHVELTAAGRIFLTDARRLLANRLRAVESARRAADGSSGRLALGFVGPAAYSVLPAVVRRYRARYPDVDLSLHEHTSAQQLDMLAAKELDVCLVRLPSTADNVELALVLTEPMCVVLPADHRWAARPDGEPLDVAELADDRFVMVPRSREPVVFDHCVAVCLDVGFSPVIVQEAQQIHAIIGLVAAGMGVALVPDSMRALRRPGVVYRALTPSAHGTVETGVVWRQGDASPVVDAFVELCRNARL